MTKRGALSADEADIMARAAGKVDAAVPGTVDPVEATAALAAVRRTRSEQIQ